MKIQSLVIGALVATAAVPASAVTVVASFNGAGSDIAMIQNTSNPFFTLEVSGRSYTGVASNALTNLTANTPTARNLTRNAGGLGITGGGSGAQMDTNSATRREAFLVTGSAAFYLTNLTLTSVDQDDTLQIYGVRGDNSLVNFTYGFGNNPANDAQARIDGAIVGGANGSFVGNVRTGANGGTNALGTGIVSGVGSEKFTSYLITTRVGGEVFYLGTQGQGFSLSALTATVPEPATWAMLVVGFGLVGFARRRRVTTVAA